MTINANHIAVLLTVAQAAIDHQRGADRTKRAKEAYYEACSEWKDAHGFDRYDKLRADNLDAFDSMMTACAAEYCLYGTAQKAERNAKRRLWTAVRKAEAA